MKKSIIFLFIVASISLSAQQSGFYSNYLSDKILVNPAFAGYNENTEITLLAKSYFLGFTDKNPGTQAISVTGRKDNYGLGLSLTNDYFGNSRNTGLKLAYAYHLQAGDNSKLSFSLAPGFSQYAINQTSYIYFDDNDNVITGSKESKLVFNADFGILYFSDDYFAGISVHNLTQPNISTGANTSEENRLLRTYDFCGSYRYNFSDEFGIQPALLMSITPGFFTADISSRFLIKNFIWVGLGYKTTNFISTMFGVSYKNFRLGYAFDHSFSEISSFSNGTHEIVIGYEFLKATSSPKL